MNLANASKRIVVHIVQNAFHTLVVVKLKKMFMKKRILMIPKSLTLPMGREPHCSSAHCWVVSEESLKLMNESVGSINRIEPVGYTAEECIGCSWYNSCYIYPRILQRWGQLWHHGKHTIPNTGMMGAMVAQYIDGYHPTVQCFRFRYTKTTGDAFSYGCVGKVTIEFSKAAERHQLQHFPSRRKVCIAIVQRMVLNEVLLRTLQFSFQCSQVLSKLQFVNSQRNIEKPKRTISQREFVNHARTQGNLYFLHCTEQQFTQFHIKRIECCHLFNCCVGTERMVGLFKYAKIGSETEITDIVEKQLGCCHICNDKTTVLQNGNLVADAKCRFGIIHKRIYKKSSAMVRCSAGSAADSDGTKLRQII